MIKEQIKEFERPESTYLESEKNVLRRKIYIDIIASLMFFPLVVFCALKSFDFVSYAITCVGGVAAVLALVFFYFSSKKIKYLESKLQQIYKLEHGNFPNDEVKDAYYKFRSSKNILLINLRLCNRQLADTARDKIKLFQLLDQQK